MEVLINIVVLLLMVAVTIGIVRLRNLFAVVMLGGIYSFLMATILYVLDAVDVSMTEAAVGAGISTVLLLATLAVTKVREAAPIHPPALPLAVALVTGAALIYASVDMPPFGDPLGPGHQHVAPEYIARVLPETHIPNAVTSVLASYRGYDTLGETTVIFTAGIGVLALLVGRRRPRRSDGASGGGNA